MSDPLDVVNVEADGDAAVPNAPTNTKRKAPNANNARQRNPAGNTVQLNPNNFDWFLAGIDQARLEGILGGSKGQESVMMGNNMMKMEDTFLMVRDDGEAGADPLNDVGVGMKLFPDADEMMMDASAFRNIPDEPAGFEDALLRGDMGDLYDG